MNIQIDWQKTDHIAIALSGGVDSMVLYHLLKHQYANTYKALSLIHVNHNIREASSMEEAALHDIATHYNDPIFVKRVNFEKDKFSQSLAREKRYQFFYEVMSEYTIDVLLTAHHSDDQVETILQEILTGKTQKLKLGIPARRMHKGIHITRPLIHLSKNQIKAYANHNDVIYFEDDSNTTNDYTRNYIRNEIITKIDAHSDLNKNHLLELKEDFDNIAELVDTTVHHLVQNQMINRSLFIEQNNLIQRHILLYMINAEVSKSYLNEIIRVICENTAQAEYVINGKRLMIQYNKIVVEDMQSDFLEEMTIDTIGKYEFNGYTINVHSTDILPLYVRTRRNGDKISLPNVGTKKISRIFIDCKISQAERQRLPIICNETNQIIAVGDIYNIINEKKTEKEFIVQRSAIHDTKKSY